MPHETRAGREAGELIEPASEAWQAITSVEDVLDHAPDRIETLLGALDLDRPGLEKVKAAVEAGEKAAACEALLDYYAGPGRKPWVIDLLGEPGDGDVARAEITVAGRHEAQGGVGGAVATRHGAWDWNDAGPKNDREYAFNLNRHPFFTHLGQAWRKTGEAKYAETFDRRVRDWILHAVYPGLESHEGTWTWRVLEAGLRMRSWTFAFHGFQASEAFTPAARLLMLASFVEHGRYIRKFHWRRHNHALMEHDGLNRLALAFPEFEASEAWHRYAFEQMLEEMDHQVYPDGAHDELSSGYHGVSLSSFENLAQVAMAAGREVPGDYMERIVAMYDYWAGLVRPDGSLPQNNRSDRGKITGRLLAAAERYGREDWRYAATQGAAGARPEDPPSRLFRWAGHLVSRSGWEAGSLWSFFDAGPAGAGWVHADALHLSLSAFGKDFLVDSGRFWYMRDKWTRFAHESRAHNVILIDQQGQAPRPKRTGRPLGESDGAAGARFDFARRTHEHFEGLEGEAAHTRAVVFLREAGCWVVLDRIATDRPRRLTAMWHFRPERAVSMDEAGRLVTEDTEGANLSITPVGPVDWEGELIRGQESPYVQGWYSEFTPNWEPNSVAELTGRIGGDVVFAWVMVPVEAGAAAPVREAALEVEAASARLRFTAPGGRAIRLEIPLAPASPAPGEPSVEVGGGEAHAD